MKSTATPFTSRQVMLRLDYEFFHSRGTRPLDIAYHSHDFYEVLLFLSGKAEYIIEGRTYVLRPGDILLTNDRELHRPLVEPGRIYERYVLWIRPDYIRQIQGKDTDLTACFQDASRRQYKRLRTGGERLARLLRICARLDDVYDSKAYGDAVLERAYVAELLAFLNQAYFDVEDALDGEADVEENRKINEMVQYINDHLSGDLTLDALSARFYSSKYHLSRQFKQYTGLSPHQYIIKKRLIAARHKLRDGQTVREVYLDSGFGDYANFSKAFKAEFGLSPRLFMQQADEGRALMQDTEIEELL